MDVIRGDAAQSALADGGFVARWRTLHETCPHATAFQGPAFVRAWYAAYRERWEPIIVRAHDAQGSLAGLWLLAYDGEGKTLAHAGTHQAEYHTWLAVPGYERAFLQEAWSTLTRQIAFATLRFRYLPGPEPSEALQAALGGRASIAARTHPRPLMILNPEEIRESLAKKSNKSRFNRLKRLGELQFRRIPALKDLDPILDDLIDFYDFRQGAANDTSPFREDPRKRDFHRALLATAPNETHVTVTLLNGRPIAALWGAVSGAMVHLGMLLYSPFVAEHSPGKLHLLQLGDSLLKEGQTALDLTPGGDPWKERFANAHDTVGEAILYVSRWRWLRDRAGDRVARWGSAWLRRAGLSPGQARSMLARLRRQRPSTIVAKVSHWRHERREFRVYRAERPMAERQAADIRVRRNSLGDLLAFEPGESWQTREGFLSAALERLERGEAAYTVRIDGRLAHVGWMVMNQEESHMTEVKQSVSFPPGSVALYDFYSHPDFRGRGLYRATIGHMMREAFADPSIRFAFISVMADNLPSRHVIETMGFEFQGSFFWERRWGAERKWAGEMKDTSRA